MYLFNVSYFYKYTDSKGVQRKHCTSNSYIPVIECDLERYFFDIFFKGFNKSQIKCLDNKIILENENNYNEIMIFKMIKLHEINNVLSHVMEIKGSE